MDSLRSHSGMLELGSLFSSPHVTVLLLWACQGTGYSSRELQKIVLRDSALCTKIISTARKISPHSINPSAPLSSSLDALDLPVIKNLSIQSAKRIVDQDLDPEQVQFMRELWFCSQVGGIVSRRLAEQIAYSDPEEAQVAGLLMNIGMLSFFSRDPERYMVTAGSSTGSDEVVQREQTGYEDDHLQLADTLVSSWGLESFMPDAIGFQHLASEQLLGAHPLIRIVRLAREFCRSPLELSPEIGNVAGQLFDFTAEQTKSLFEGVVEHCRSLSPQAKGTQEGFGDFNSEQKRLISVVFSIAGQDGACPRFANPAHSEEFVESARHLYLNSSSAREAVIFTLDPRESMLCAMRGKGEQRMVDELTMPRQARSLLGEALAADKVRHSFNREKTTLSVFDRQLLRVCRSAGIVCVPLVVEDRPLGGVVLGVDHAYEAESFSEPQMRMLSGSVARTLASLWSLQQQNFAADLGQAPAVSMSKLIHEVGSPLAIITNYLGAIGSLDDDGKRAEVFAAIDGEVQRIGNILDYHRSLNEAGPSQSARVDVNELIHALLDRLGPSFFQPKKIELVTELDGALPPVVSKPVAITQILVNLLKNASEALEPGGEVVLTTREVVTAESEAFIEISIHDNGPGIDEDILRQLFSPVKSTKGEGHSGLGLNIVKEMANDIEATISCHSSRAHGTRFSLMVPARVKSLNE